MPQSTLRPLNYTAIDELRAYSDKSMRAFAKLEGRELLKQIDELHKRAGELLKDGEEEKSYILHYKYWMAVNLIKKSPLYREDPKYVNSMMGGKEKLETNMQFFAQLTKNLQSRYQQQNKRNSTPAVLPSNGASSSLTRNPQTNGVGPTAAAISDDGTIDVHDFLRLIMDPQVGVLVLDCRPSDDFQESHINVFRCLNIPAEIVKPGMTAGSIQQALSPDGKRMWGSRSIKDHVLLLDWNSSAGAIGSTIDTLKLILEKWDQDADYKNPLRILNGGYEIFIHTYPMHTSNPHYRPARSLLLPSKESAQANVDAIEYPDMNNIQMKDSIQVASQHGVAVAAAGGALRAIPRVDRASKLSAIRNYEKMLEQQAKLVDQTLSEVQALDEELEHADELPDAQRADAFEDMRTKRMERDNKMIVLIDQHRSLDKQVIELKHDIEQHPNEAIDERETIGARQRELEAAERTRELVLAQMREKETRLAKLRNERVQPPPPVIVQQPAIDRASKPTTAFLTPVGDWDGPADDAVVRSFQAVPGGEGHGLTGLKNLGNTCYMNSIMQCLCNTAMLREFFVSEEGYRKQFRRSSKTQRQIADEVSAVMREIWLNKHRHIASNDLRRVIGQTKQIFRGSEQQDSHEFLTILIDWLHLDLQPTLETASVNAMVPTPAEEAWQNFASSKESYIMKLFYGQIKSTVKCRVCEKESATFEGFSNLSLELPEGGNRCHITDCLNMYFFGEYISGWNCPKCKQKREAIKKLDISKLPPILVIHLKRFNVDLHSSTASYKKKTTYVDFPLSNFDMSKYIAPSERQNQRVKNTTFELYGVSNHYGEMNRGHYTAFCKSSLYNKWYKFDDHNVSRMDPSDVPSSAGYILFYATPTYQR